MAVNKRNLWVLGVVVIVVAGAVIWWLYGRGAGIIFDVDQLSAFERTQATTTPRFNLPAVKTLADGKVDLKGPVYFKVASAAKSGPFFEEVGFSPLDVKNGESQTIYVVLASDPAGLKSVSAQIKTNKDPVTLNFVIIEGDARRGTWLASWTARDLSAGWFPVEIKITNNSGTSASDTLWIKDSLFSALFGETAYAAALGGLQCTPALPVTGNDTLTAACNVYSSDGIVNGTLNLNGQSMTLQANVVFGFPGSSISLTTAGSAINIGSGASLSKTTVWVQESDGDHYWAAQAVQSSSPGAGWESRTTSGLLGGGDCNDSNANVNPGQTSYFTTATTTNMNLTTGAYDGGGEVNYDYNCNGTQTKEYPTAKSSQTCAADNVTCLDPTTWYATTTVPACGVQGSLTQPGCRGAPAQCWGSLTVQGCY